MSRSFAQSQIKKFVKRNIKAFGNNLIKLIKKWTVILCDSLSTLSQSVEHGKCMHNILLSSATLYRLGTKVVQVKERPLEQVCEHGWKT